MQGLDGVERRWRVLLADDHVMLREGLALLVSMQPDMEVVGQARNGREAVAMTQKLIPDVAVLDVSMPDMDGVQAAAQIHASCPAVHVLALTRHADEGYLRRMIGAGAVGYVVKRAAGDALIEAIRAVVGGGTYVDPSLAGSLLVPMICESDRASHARKHAALTEREEQVLRLIAWGKSSKDVATQLGISIKTVESYKAGASDKLQLRNRTDILRHALTQKWLNEENDPD